MIVLTRFRVPSAEQTRFREELQRARETLATRPGLVHSEIGRNVDDPTLWVLQTRWADVGSYRRALSSHEVKMTVVPLLSRALDEPSAFEVVEPGAELNETRSRSLP